MILHIPLNNKLIQAYFETVNDTLHSSSTSPDNIRHYRHLLIMNSAAMLDAISRSQPRQLTNESKKVVNHLKDILDEIGVKPKTFLSIWDGKSIMSTFMDTFELDSVKQMIGLLTR